MRGIEERTRILANRTFVDLFAENCWYMFFLQSISVYALNFSIDNANGNERVQRAKFLKLKCRLKIDRDSLKVLKIL